MALVEKATGFTFIRSSSVQFVSTESRSWTASQGAQ